MWAVRAHLIKNIGEYFKEQVHFAPNAEKQVYEMDVRKTGKLYALKSSEEYLKDFLKIKNGK